MKHQSLITLELLVNKFLADMTNQAYSRNHKFGYKVAWDKGVSKIADEQGNTINNYYAFTFYLVDKTESPVGNKVELYNNYYPTNLETTVDKLQELAYKDFLLNGIQSLANVTYSLYLQRKENTIIKHEEVKLDHKIEQLRESSKLPKLDLKPVPISTIDAPRLKLD